MASTVVRANRVRRWSLVATGAAVLVALPAVVAAIPARVEPISLGALRNAIVKSQVRPYQGYAESIGRLGLPDLPNLGQVTSLLSGTTRIRSWYESPDRWRFDVLTLGSERGVYHTLEGEFTWDYGANMRTELIGDQLVRLPRAGDLLPPDLARRILIAAPNDPMTALPARRVAGVSAAGLRIRPADPDTSVGQVDIWADPATGLPVRVEVTARGASQPVLVTEFRELSQTRPDPSTLVPVAPKDGGFTIATAPDIVDALGAGTPTFFPPELAGRQLQTGEFAGLPGVGRYGTGLSSFVVLALPRNLGGSATEAAEKAGARQLDLPGGSGRLLTVAPISMVIARSDVARRSYLIAGLVNPSVLERAAAEMSTVPRGGR
jgi:hypothetical protein